MCVICVVDEEGGKMKTGLLINLSNLGSAVALQATQPALGLAPGWVWSLAFILGVMFRRRHGLEQGLREAKGITSFQKQSHHGLSTKTQKPVP